MDECELRFHVLVKGESPEQAHKVRQILKETIQHLEESLQGHPLAKAQDIMAQHGGMGQAHPFFCMVPLDQVFTDKQPARDVQEEFRFQIPDNDTFQPTIAALQDWTQSFYTQAVAYDTDQDYPFNILPTVKQEFGTAILEIPGMRMASKEDLHNLPHVEGVCRAFLDMLDSWNNAYW